ncbi:MAG: hypothetical protein IJ748_03780 [Bacteroidales bacterium]|nr:hypothetical protein [Bacteroidales bacterium]
MKKNFFIISAVLFLCLQSLMAQVSPHTTGDFNLWAYPQTLRYMKFEADTSIKNQRSSFIEDYQLNFSDGRLLQERINFIDGKQDRKTTYEYNNKRQLVKETLSEKDGKIVNVITYEYNNIGRLAAMKEVSYPNSRGGANKVIKEELLTYNSKGLLVEKQVNSDNKGGNKLIKYFYGPADSLIATVTTYKHNSNVDKVNYKRAFNNLVVECTRLRNDKLTKRETFEWDDNARIVKKEVYSRDNKKILSYTYSYDEHGNVISEIALDDKNVKTIDYSYTYEKDKFFNWTKRLIYDNDNLKYTEIRSIDYFGKTHFYEDMKDADTGRILKDKE